MRTAAALSVLLVLASAARAQDSAKLNELERKVDALTSEIEKLKLGEAAEPAPEFTGRSGEAPAASKVFRARPSRVSIGGYGEITYSNFSRHKQDGAPSGQKSVADALRAIIYLGYKYNDWIVFNSETEIEHANSENTRGEIELEQAYLDFRLWEPLSARAGLMVLPLGLTNEVHEPPTFNGVQRPAVERRIIPSTWRENGFGVYGQWGPFAYRSYLTSGLQATSNTGVTGFSATGIGGGRSHGAKSFAEDVASSSRLDWLPMPGALLGASFYVGQADQDFLAASVPVTLWDAHLRVQWRGAELKALYAESRVGNADAVNAAQGVTPASGNSVGRRQYGGYAEAAYDVLSGWSGNKGHALSPFVRVERYDTQADVPELWQKNPANSRTEIVAGVTYKPIPQIALKADQQWIRNQAHTGVNQWNLGIGWLF
jgi:hypothetical protein